MGPRRVCFLRARVWSSPGGFVSLVMNVVRASAHLPSVGAASPRIATLVNIAQRLNAQLSWVRSCVVRVRSSVLQTAAGGICVSDQKMHRTEETGG